MSGVENWPIWSWAVLLFNTTDWEKGPWIIKSQSVFELRSMTQPYKTAVRKLKARWPRLCIFYSHCWAQALGFHIFFCCSCVYCCRCYYFPTSCLRGVNPKCGLGFFFLLRTCSLCCILSIIFVLIMAYVVLHDFSPFLLLHMKWAHYKYQTWIILGVNPQKSSQQKVNWVWGCQWCHWDSAEILMDPQVWV